MDWKRTYLVIGVIIFAIWVIVSLSNSNHKPSSPRNSPSLTSVRLEYQYSKGRSNVLFLNFTISNDNSYAVSDYTITCKQYGASGSHLGSISKKIYGNVEAKGKQGFDGFEMGLADSQAKRVTCEVTNLAAG